MGEAYTKTSGVAYIKQSPPVDLSKPYDVSWVKGKHVIVTGGASGFGYGFCQKWANAGASVIIADINTKSGSQAAINLKKETGNDNIHFVHCDVTDWQSQAALFKEAARLSPHGGIDCVVANAGIAGKEPLHDLNKNLDVAEPEKPNLAVVNVNLVGVLYTTYLALWWLEKNPGSKPCSPETDPTTNKRDRHILLVGSIASLGPIVSQPLYGVSKHGVLGLFRTLRASAMLEGVRVNAIFPYFIETPILDAGARAVLAGGAIGKPEDVVDAASRLVADSSILGRGLCIGPKCKVKQQEDGEWVVVSKESAGEERAIWEAYADDFEDTELFTQRLIKILNGVVGIKGWVGMLKDLFGALKYGIFG
ncbi:NAD(P)-binding protein [Venturia nashicola]|uniref:NAD(P)-binding protein n=1 Tax=Venturia nashicola TaxID=86259 RepID=A0A4Z1NYV2_9PEZI|nr:NAD(P)-binding protein [Venturia nashicola]TLD14787.1 NAD(P)-binding protein [Venturia nashicola]